VKLTVVKTLQKMHQTYNRQA